MKTSVEKENKGNGTKVQRIISIAASTLLFFVLFVIIAFFVMRSLGEKEFANVNAGEVPMIETTETEEGWQDGWVRYNGKVYAYNEDILTFLIMGIDKDGKVEKAKDGLSGGQADAMFLGVMNPHTDTISVIAINRNAMVPVDVYDEDGVYMGQYDKQITLQHGYGDGMELSCERCVATVSRLFYNLPIHGYAAINMGAIRDLNDVVGGVEVTVLDDVIYPEFDMDLHKGDEVRLTGHQAYWYVRARYEYLFNSSSLRLERQKQYLSNFVAQTKKMALDDIGVIMDLYNTVLQYMVTDVDITEITYLATEALSYKFDQTQIYSMQGETIMGESFEEFYVDDDALYDMIIKIFYEPVEMEE